MNVSINFIKKNIQYSISRKSVHWETNWSVRTDRRRYVTKFVADFAHCFAEVPEKNREGKESKRRK